VDPVASIPASGSKAAQRRVLAFFGVVAICCTVSHSAAHDRIVPLFVARTSAVDESYNGQELRPTTLPDYQGAMSLLGAPSFLPLRMDHTALFPFHLELVKRCFHDFAQRLAENLMMH
jgi:hypothetical protein